MTAGMLDQGAGNLDAESFSKAIDALGASFGAGVGQTSTTVSLSSIAANFDKALPLFADAILRPRFDQSDFERQRSNHLDELAQQADDPEAVARLVAMREFFGPAHPYGRNSGGSQGTVKLLTLSDLKQEHDLVYRPDNATLFVSGSLPLEQVKASLEKQFGAWKAPAIKPVSSLQIPPAANKAFRVLIVDKPQAVQTVIRFVFPGEPYSSPKRPAIEAIATLLGGTFTSRLNANLREAKGYTYGASARSVFETGLGYMTAGSSVRADVTGASLQEFLNEFARLRTGDVQEVEALKARASMRTDTISSLESLSGIIGTLEALHQHGQTMSDLARELQGFSTLTPANLNPLAKQSVSLDNAVLVLVGDKDLILKQIATLKLPKPEIVPGLQ